MNKLSYKDADGELVTKQQMAECINTGISTVCKIAEEAGAVRRIGRNYRINKKKVLEYIEQNYSE